MNLGIGLSLSSARTAGGGASYSAEATAYFARRATQPDATRKGLMNTLILSLLTGAVSGSNIWAKGDILSLYADTDSADALLNWKSSSYAATNVNSTTFTTDRGFTGNGTTMYLDTNFADNTAAVNWSRDSASYGIWINQDPVNSLLAFGVAAAAVNLSLTPRSTGTGLMSIRLHSGTTLTAAVANRLGFSSASRTTSTNTAGYRDGSNLGTSAGASTAPGAYNLSVFRNNASYGSDRVACLWVGGALTDNEMLDLYNALLTYLTAIGAN